jgi:hypothetical protein
MYFGRWYLARSDGNLGRAAGELDLRYGLVTKRQTHALDASFKTLSHTPGAATLHPPVSPATRSAEYQSAESFLFPTPRAFEMSHGTAPDQVTTDLGESQVVIDWVHHRLAMHLADCAALLDEYLAAIGAQRERLLKDETMRIRRLSQHASVLQPNEEDRRRVARDRVGASRRAASNWTLNAAHGYYVRTGLRASVVDVALSFKALNGQITPIGVFSLDLQALARAGAVNVRQVDGHDVFDVRIIRDEDGVYWLAGQDRIRQLLR